MGGRQPRVARAAAASRADDHRALDRADVGDDRPRLRAPARSARPTASYAPTGTQRMTQSAPPTARARSSVDRRRQAPAPSPARATPTEWSARTMRRAALRRRAARAIDEPISPTPMIASSSKIGSASGAPSRSTTFAPHELGKRRDHAPVGLLAADRQPQRVRQAIGRDRPEDEAARAEERVRVRGGPAGSSGKVRSRKFPTLGVTSTPSSAIASASHGSQRELCAIAPSIWATSSRLATPAAFAAPLRLNGPRTRFNASRTCAGP